VVVPSLHTIEIRPILGKFFSTAPAAADRAAWSKQGRQDGDRRTKGGDRKSNLVDLENASLFTLPSAAAGFYVEHAQKGGGF
jgi:hypothetical protein